MRGRRRDFQGCQQSVENVTDTESSCEYKVKKAFQTDPAETSFLLLKYAISCGIIESDH